MAAVQTGVKPESDRSIPAELDVPLESLHCVSCNRFLAYYALVEGTVAVKCRRCQTWNVVNTHAIQTQSIDRKSIQPDTVAERSS